MESGIPNPGPGHPTPRRPDSNPAFAGCVRICTRICLYIGDSVAYMRSTFVTLATCLSRQVPHEFGAWRFAGSWPPDPCALSVRQR
jgi:hypothetical protein